MLEKIHQLRFSQTPGLGRDFTKVKQETPVTLKSRTIVKGIPNNVVLSNSEVCFCGE
jgi:hypothetical protein